MRTKDFCRLIEAAMKKEYGDESNFATVQHLPDEGGEARECLGIFVLPEQHMATVAARAQCMLFDERTFGERTFGENASSVDLQETCQLMDELVGGLHRMRIAPYMQWHCAYFPGLTEAQVLAEAEMFDSVDARGSVELAGDGPRPAAITPQTLFEDFVHIGIATSWYSGRGMAGVECLSISGDTASCRSAVAGVIADHAGDGDGERFEELAETLLAFHQDQLGHGVVLYWPDLMKPGDHTGDGSTVEDPVQAVLSELAGMLETKEIDEARHLAATRWAEAHRDDIVTYRTSMKVSEIADTVLTMSVGGGGGQI